MPNGRLKRVQKLERNCTIARNLPLSPHLTINADESVMLKPQKAVMLTRPDAFKRFVSSDRQATGRVVDGLCGRVYVLERWIMRSWAH